MARDKAKDDLLFNCNQSYELDQVAGHYGVNKDKVLQFLQDSCKKGDIYHSTHLKVYGLIKSKLGYSIPV
ncbi:MAG: hypothetical protein EG825_05390 [Rhodocyclaceae bacterium]|nr:hypothetical protein [Rhodocyclaceae bacterium]